jgi:thioredoxin-dependent peroxiredoxin
MLKPGDVAPDFSAQDHLGRTVALKDLKGKTVVLWFYPKADTPGCTAEGCSFRDLNAEFQKKNVAVFGVSFDSAADNKAFAEKFHFPFPLLCDTDRKLGLAYGAADDQSAATARRAGVVIGPDGKVREHHAKVDARTFAGELLARL